MADMSITQILETILKQLDELGESNKSDKGILEFNLPESRGDFKLASSALDWALVSWDMADYLRGLLKHNTQDFDIKTLEAIHEHLFDLLDNYGVSLNDIE